MDDRDRSIIRQVAFKGAIELVPTHIKWVLPSGEVREDNPTGKELAIAVKWLTDQFEAIILNTK